MKNLKKMVAVIMIFVLLMVSTTSVFATQKESQAGTQGNVGDTILPPGADNAYIIWDEFSIDLPLGSGSAQCVLNTHYYDPENHLGRMPAVTVGMGTSVTADMWAYVSAIDIYGGETVLDHRASQTTSFYARAESTFISNGWASYSCDLGACDDDGDATFYLINHYADWGFPENSTE